MKWNFHDAGVKHLVSAIPSVPFARVGYMSGSQRNGTSLFTSYIQPGARESSPQSWYSSTRIIPRALHPWTGILFIPSWISRVQRLTLYFPFVHQPRNDSFLHNYYKRNSLNNIYGLRQPCSSQMREMWCDGHSHVHSHTHRSCPLDPKVAYVPANGIKGHVVLNTPHHTWCVDDDGWWWWWAALMIWKFSFLMCLWTSRSFYHIHTFFNKVCSLWIMHAFGGAWWCATSCASCSYDGARSFYHILFLRVMNDADTRTCTRIKHASTGPGPLRPELPTYPAE